MKNTEEIRHYINGRIITPPYPKGYEVIVFGMGCFWGAERVFWNLEGVFITAAGYTGGKIANPTYEEVCSGMSGHFEAVLVVYDPQKISYEVLLKTFFENHDPTQLNKQGNDYGTEYRSSIACLNQKDYEKAVLIKEKYNKQFRLSGFLDVVTEIIYLDSLDKFYFAEIRHQQYLGKYPNGYCGIKGTGVTCQL